MLTVIQPYLNKTLPPCVIHHKADNYKRVKSRQGGLPARSRYATALRAGMARDDPRGAFRCPQSGIRKNPASPGQMCRRRVKRYTCVCANTATEQMGWNRRKFFERNAPRIFQINKRPGHHPCIRKIKGLLNNIFSLNIPRPKENI